MEDAAELLTPAEADWPPELRLPPPPPQPPPAQAMGMDDSQFLGSIMGEPPPHQQQAPAEAPVGVKRKRGRPPKNRDGAAVVAAKAKATAAAAKPTRRREDEEEVVCFICFDGGNLVVCDRRGCPKVYHPACIKREESFFQSRSKWNCGWHICSGCEKAAHYMCYTCTYSVCKVCIKQGKFFSVRGTKGFCDTCFGTILLIESKDGSTKAGVDFDDQNSWEYLFKLYWLDLKGKLTLTLEELTSAKSRWNVPSTYARKEKAESSDDLYDANNDDDAGSDCSSGKRKRTNSSRKRGQKRRKANSNCSIAAKMVGIAAGDAGSLSKKVSSEGVSLPVDTKWASPELLEFVGHMRDRDQSFISQFDVQTLLLDYIKQNNLRDPRRKSQIICDSRLHRLFRKTRVAHFEMLKLLETHFVVNEASTVSNNSQGVINPNSAQLDASGYSYMAAKLSPDRRRRMHRKMEREPNANLEDYAAVDMHNINLIYLRRSLMEDLIDDASFSDKIVGAFVRIRISGVGQKQDMYRLVKVIGTHKVLEKYSIGKKVTNFALEILNLDKKEIITMDTISNQDFTKEECKRLWQSMKCGLISRLKVGDVLEKAKIFQSARVNDWLENEKQRLGHLRDRASETGRRKELRECVEKLQLLNTSEERTRRINEVLEVHADSHMYPDYESAEEMDDKKAVERNVSRRRSDAFFSPLKVKYSNTVQNHAQKNSDASCHPKNLSKQSTIRKSGAGRNSENFHSGIGADIPKSGINVNSTMCEAASLSCSGATLSTDMEPEKVWHYKDPSGNVQGPFTLLQLSKWTSYFPRDLRVWLTFESEERSLLLTEVLSKQPKDFSQAASVTTSIKATLAGSGQNRNIPNVDLNNTLSPVGYSMLNSPEITVQSTKYSVPERESVNSLDDRLSLLTSSVPPKDADTSISQVQYQTKHSGFPPSPGSPCGQLDLNHDGVQPRRSGEWNNRHSSGGLWSPTMPQTSCSGQSNVESHHNQHAMWSQVQHDSKSSLQAGSVKDLNSRLDYSQNLPSQRIGRDVSSPVFSWSPSESRTASGQHEGSCLSSTTNPSIHDELHSSIVSAKAKSCAPATPVEDRGSSSPSGMLSHSGRVPICCPQSTPASASEICKMEVINQQKTLEADASNASVNQSPQSKILPESSPDNQDIEREYPSPTPRSESKEPAVDHSGSTSVAPEICKMEIMNQQKTLEADASNASVNQSPQSKILPESSPDNQDIEREYPSPTPRSESKEPAVDHSGSTSVAPEICKMEIMNQQKPLEADASNASVNQSPQSKILPESSPDNQDIEREYPSPTPRSESKEPAVDHSGSTSVAPEICKMEIMNQQKPLEADASNASVNQSPQSKISPESSPDNQDIEREYPSPTPRSESKEPAVDHSGSTSVAPKICKMEIMNQQKTHEADASNASVNQSPQYKIFPESSDNQDIEREYPSPTPRSESKEPAMDHSGSTSLSPQNLATKIPDHSPVAFVSPKSGPPTGEICATKSVSSLGKTDFKGEDSNVQNELYIESTLVTRVNTVVDPASCAESIDVSDVLESLIDQSCETSYMDGTAALEDSMTASAEEEPQCSSPIALSPWGEPGYYQGDAVDSALWGVQDDPINDMWSLCLPTPALQLSSGVETDGKGTACVMNEVTVTQGNNEIVQRGPTPGEKKVELANSGASTAWGLVEQVKSKANDASVSSMDGSTGVVGWQPSANESSNVDTAWSTSQNPNLSSSYETAAPSCRSSQEASRKQECTYLNAASSGEALGNAKSWNPSTGNANRGSQRSHHHGRYSQISESWLLSSNYSRSRSDGFGSDGSSRTVPRGQTQRGICKFHEIGCCRKGASCNYLHPWSPQ